MPNERVVDNRVFMLGLDELYRKAMKRHERGELLACARRVAQVLQVPPADVPVEGYYAEDPELSEYFRLSRTLQQTGEEHVSAVARLPEFQRLLSVASSPLYGRPQHTGKLLPTGDDALSQALEDTRPEWTVARLTDAAHARAVEMNDISLVGLAARTRDAVVLTAVRESVVLYAKVLRLGAEMSPPRWTYLWMVDEELAELARTSIEAFNVLFDDGLPAPEALNAATYWHAHTANDLVGRCVRIGFDDSTSSTRHYHWAICRGADRGMSVQEFWKPEVWTTTRYRSLLQSDGVPRGEPCKFLLDEAGPSV